MSKDLIQDQRRIVSHKWLHLFIISRGNSRKIHENSQKSINDFNLVILNPYPKLTYQEKKIGVDYFDASFQDQCIETNPKRILTHVLMRWNEDKSNAHPSTCALTAAETVALKIYSIELK